ncbi:hypothetical protein ACNFIC_22225 [Pseudomonas sp. NY15463]|uniref:hypothetical protein n=1 Tax=Pseudomonas sp. NY15463 TaxID=3400361 RepID=UPI003A84C16C
MNFCDVIYVAVAVLILFSLGGGLIVFFRPSTEGKLPEKITALCAVLALLVAVLAAVVAWSQLQESKWSAALQLRESKTQSANDIYKEYISLAMQHPEISAQSCYGGEAGLKKIKKSPKQYEEYENFVAFMLFSAEQILELKGSEWRWGQVIKAQLVYHAVYLKSAHFQIGMRDFYSKDLQDLIHEAIVDYSREECGRDYP